MGFRRKSTASAQVEEKVVTKEVTKGGTGKKTSGKTYHNNVLSILKGKEEGSVYVQINPKSDVVIMIDGKKVTGMFSKDPFVELEESVEAGRLSPEKAEEIADKIPEFILANVTLVTE